MDALIGGAASGLYNSIVGPSSSQPLSGAASSFESLLGNFGGGAKPDGGQSQQPATPQQQFQGNQGSQIGGFCPTCGQSVMREMAPPPGDTQTSNTGSSIIDTVLPLLEMGLLLL